MHAEQERQGGERHLSGPSHHGQAGDSCAAHDRRADEARLGAEAHAASMTARSGGRSDGSAHDRTSTVTGSGRLAQLVRALPSHGRGRGFESPIAHSLLSISQQAGEEPLVGGRLEIVRFGLESAGSGTAVLRPCGGSDRGLRLSAVARPDFIAALECTRRREAPLPRALQVASLDELGFHERLVLLAHEEGDGEPGEGFSIDPWRQVDLYRVADRVEDASEGRSQGGAVGGEPRGHGRFAQCVQEELGVEDEPVLVPQVQVPEGGDGRGSGSSAHSIVDVAAATSAAMRRVSIVPHGEEQLVLGGVVAVEGTAGEPGASADLLDRGPGEPDLDELLSGCGEEADASVDPAPRLWAEVRALATSFWSSSPWLHPAPLLSARPHRRPVLTGYTRCNTVSDTGYHRRWNHNLRGRPHVSILRSTRRVLVTIAVVTVAAGLAVAAGPAVSTVGAAGTPTISVGDASVHEGGHGGNRTLSFNVAMSEPAAMSRHVPILPDGDVRDRWGRTTRRCPVGPRRSR